MGVPHRRDSNDWKPVFPGKKLMEGKKGIVFGVANHLSIAWGIAKTLSEHGAELILVCQNEKMESKVRGMCENIPGVSVTHTDVLDSDGMDSLFSGFIKNKWDKFDFLVHSLANSYKNELQGMFLDTTKENFDYTMGVSCFSFVDMVKRAHSMMYEGGSFLTMTYLGSSKVVPNYNVMGVAKAALEASVRYLASDLGSMGIRVNAMSSGPVRTLSGKVIPSGIHVYNHSHRESLLGSNISLKDLGGAALYLLSEIGSGVTGQVVFVDNGYSQVGVPRCVKE